MPLIINDTSIEYLNGPTFFIFLTPPKDSVLNYNIMLLGDIHNTKNYTQCNNTPEIENCYETNQLVEQLNEYASNNRVDFYTENPVIDIKSKHNLEMLKKNQKEAENFFNKTPITKRLSNMQLLESLVKPCYFKDTYKETLCPYKNIYWHYSDTRSNSSLYLTRIKNIQSIFCEIRNNRLTAETFSDFMDDFSENDKIYLEEMLNMLNLYKEIINNNSDAYINGLFNEESPYYVRLLKKQYDKLLPEMKGVITMESFNVLYNHHMDVEFRGKKINPSKRRQEYDIIIIVLDKIIEILTTTKIYEGEINTKVRDFCTELNTYNQLITEEMAPDEGEGIILIITYMASNMYLDLYFILRIFKKEAFDKDKDTYNHVLKKLIVNYSGNNHLTAISYYLTNVCGYSVFYEQQMMEDMRRIHITKNINLNTIYDKEDPPRCTTTTFGDQIKRCCEGVCKMVGLSTVYKDKNVGGKKNKTKRIKTKRIKRIKTKRIKTKRTKRIKTNYKKRTNQK